MYWSGSKEFRIPIPVRWDEKTSSWDIPLDTYNFAVIGNICEDPELLKVNKHG